jgi:hypothetical protein
MQKKTFQFLILAVGLFFFRISGFPQKIALTDNGASTYKIVEDGDAENYKVSVVLSSYIKNISGANIPIVNDKGSPQENEIIIGNSKHINLLHIDFNTNGIGKNTCVIKTFGNTILLTGGSDSATAHCVYYFIEKYLGCRAFSSDVSLIPKNKSIDLPAINETYTPFFTYRDVYYKDAYDSNYTKFNRIDHYNAGGKDRKWGEIWSASFRYVIPGSDYFKSHPEYFALNEKGERIPDQLDLTNEDMFNLYVKNFREIMKRYPKSQVWSVAPNDAGTPNYCHCNKCEIINKREGTPMGTLLNFVNRIAALFPDKTIATQAYLYYEEPPKTIRPAKNVLIVECGSINLNHAGPYESTTDAATGTYRRRIKGWLAIAPGSQMRIWDYVTDFPYLMSPFPNFQTIQKNLQYFKSLGIKDIFMQGNIATGGEFPELRAYIISKLLWNPDANASDIENDFLNNYYGKAGPLIRQYIDKQTAALIASNIPLVSQDHPHKHYKGFLAPNLLVEYNKIFDNAENAVKDNTVVLERVKVARLPLIYAMLEMSKMVNIVNKKQNVNASIGYSGDKSILDLLDYFIAMCKKHGIEKMAEYPTTVNSFQAEFTKYVKNNF